MLRTFFLTAATAAALLSADWGRFRGPNGTGVDDTHPLPAKLSADTNVVWKTPLPNGYSSPVLNKTSIFLTAFEGDKLYTMCLDRATGRINWRREAPRPRTEKVDKRNSPASPTPVIDGDSLYVFFGDYGLLSYGLDGNEKWRTPVGPFNNVYGIGVSPVVAGNTIVLVIDQNRESFAAGFDKKTGKQKWRTPRPEALSGASTPAVHGKLVIAPASFRVDAYDADTGEIVWYARGLASEMKSVPVIVGDKVLISGYNTPENDPGKQMKLPEWEDVLRDFDKNKDGFISKDESPNEQTRRYFMFEDIDENGKLDAHEWKLFQLVMGAENGLLAFHLGGKGDITQSGLLWKYHRSVPQLPTLVAYKGIVYMINDSGVLSTIDLETGKPFKTARVRGAADSYYSSIIAGDNKVYFFSRSGKITVLEAGPDQKEVSTSELDAEIVATPAIGDGRIYVRTTNALYCFRNSE
jgi:outer membrane protein assembly factor BamB